MKTHTVVTPANIEIEYRLAGAGSRLAAFVVDFTIQILLCLALGLIILFGIYDYRFATLADVEGFALGFLIISWFVIYFCYFIFLEMKTNGQSVGKKIFGLRIICDNGMPIALPQVLARNLFRSVIDIVYVGLFFILFSEKHKRIGDMVAGTVVIAEHFENSGPSLLPRHLPSVGQTISDLQHLTLSTEEKQLLSAYFARKMQLPDNGLVLSHKWISYFAKKWNVNEAIIDDALLAGLLQLNEEKY